jgi:predicted dinucleotide-binding enzyme
MKYGVLGTGVVGQTIGAKLVQLGHQVCLGSRTEANQAGKDWVGRAGDGASMATFASAADFGERLFNCLPGVHAIDVLSAIPSKALADKMLVDVTNPLDFSAGFPPSLSVVNTDSLGEQIQRALPNVAVVKSLNTVNAALMVDPKKLPGLHNIFVAGDDPDAKHAVVALLADFGWAGSAVIDLGGIEASRAMEMYLPLWLQLMNHVGSPDFNIRVVNAGGPTG